MVPRNSSATIRSKALLLTYFGVNRQQSFVWEQSEHLLHLKVECKRKSYCKQQRRQTNKSSLGPARSKPCFYFPCVRTRFPWSQLPPTIVLSNTYVAIVYVHCHVKKRDGGDSYAFVREGGRGMTQHWLPIVCRLLVIFSRLLLIVIVAWSWLHAEMCGFLH